MSEDKLKRFYFTEYKNDDEFVGELGLYIENLLATQKKEILEKIIKEFEYGGEQYYGGSTTRLPIILEVREWLKKKLNKDKT